MPSKKESKMSVTPKREEVATAETSQAAIDVQPPENQETAEHQNAVAYVCPLCLAQQTTNAVIIPGHTVLLDAQGNTEVCIACRSCVELWLPSILHHSGDDSLEVCPQCNSALVFDEQANEDSLKSILVAFEEEVERFQQLQTASASNLSAKGAGRVKGPPKELIVRNVATHSDAEEAKSSNPLFFCVDHKQEKLGFCMDCDMPVCYECFVSTHACHRGRRIVDVAKSACDDLNNALATLSKSNGEGDGTTASQEFLSSAIPQVEARKAQLIADITSTFDDFLALIQQRKEALTQNVSEIFERSRGSISEQLSLFSQTEQQLDSFRRSVNLLTSSSQPAEFLRVKQLLHKRLESLRVQVERLHSSGAGESIVKETLRVAMECRFEAHQKDQAFDTLKRVVDRLGSLHVPGQQPAVIAQAPAKLNDFSPPKAPRATTSPGGKSSSATSARPSPFAALPPPPGSVGPRSIPQLHATPMHAGTMLGLQVRLPVTDRKSGGLSDAQDPTALVGAAVGAAGIADIAGVSKRKQFLSVGDEVQSGEPPRNKTRATLNVNQLFMPQKKAGGGGDGGLNLKS